MNRRRTEKRCGPLSVAVLVAAAALVAFGGIVFVCYKNQQIKVARLIEQSEQRSAQHRNDIRTTEMRMDQLLNRYEMRDQLKEIGSVMCPVSPEMVEVIEPGVPEGSATMASNRP